MNKDSNDRLSRVRLLENLNSEAIASLEKRSRWRRYARDEQILDRDSDSRDVFLVVEGSVEVVNYSISGARWRSGMSPRAVISANCRR